MLDLDSLRSCKVSSINRWNFQEIQYIVELRKTQMHRLCPNIFIATSLRVSLLGSGLSRMLYGMIPRSTMGMRK